MAYFANQRKIIEDMVDMVERIICFDFGKKLINLALNTKNTKNTKKKRFDLLFIVVNISGVKFDNS